MKQEDEELLMKDLCARLPYGVKCEVYNCIGVLDEVTTLYGVVVTCSNGPAMTCRINKCKPYLFPLSSMTEEERIAIGNEFVYGQPHKATDILHKRHIDYRGLIPKGFAIDATGLNVY